jgi:hypothetical protein
MSLALCLVISEYFRTVVRQGSLRTLFVALETPAPPEAKLTPFA